MKTVGEARIWLKENLKSVYASEELDPIVFLVLHSITKLPPTQLRAFPEKQLSEAQTQMLLLSAQKLQTGMPVQYLLGETEFFGLKFEINPSVLIPRPETEELVAWVMEEKGSLSGDKRSGERGKLKAESLMPKAILDIGTGSGCIPISIKKNWSEAEVFALDISAEALQTAQKNASLNQVEVHFFQQDILNFIPVKEASCYSIIVSNPPYITPKEQLQMHHNVLAFEPHLALFVPENDPLLFYRVIAGYASFALQKNGLLFFEVNEKYGKQVFELLKGENFIDIEIRKDLSGKDRMVRAKLG
ncbi:peptide chain release factor N(5)-glutamine methyltransferase [uncultured Mucilaginibacter sp.]|uniref:peptide chain release factor N(5)-glutamine methyltransferase n=1 Tax=uncultured Mucilaginibacter sp. TaxID=797541 RepID=UPI002635CA6E|nr:peptide chain release factor N(5)-glutamine methyltransferase [uncultured Mucilaginibacter sp.]